MATGAVASGKMDLKWWSTLAALSALILGAAASFGDRMWTPVTVTTEHITDYRVHVAKAESSMESLNQSLRDTRDEVKTEARATREDIKSLRDLVEQLRREQRRDRRSSGEP